MGAPIPNQSWYPSITQYRGELYLQAGERFRWNGDAWQQLGPAQYPQDLAQDEEAHLQGATYSIVPRGCSAPTEVDDHAFCIIEGDILHHRDGGSDWRSTIADPFAQTMRAGLWGTVPVTLWTGGKTYSAWGTGPNDVYRVVTGVLEHFDGETWSVASDETCVDVSGTASDHVVAATMNGLLLLDADKARLVPVPDEFGGPRVGAVQALTGGRALALTRSHALLWKDDELTVLYAVQGGWTLSQLRAAAPDDLWMVRSQSSRTPIHVLMHYDGESWRDVEESRDVLGDIATEGSETWLIGASVVRRVEPPGISIDAEWTPWGARLSLTDEHLWIGTPTQMMRKRR